MDRAEGLASVWLFHDGLGRYMRSPLVEAPRELSEWGDERAGACQDLVWHPMDSWWDTGDRLVVVPVGFPPFGRLDGRS